MNKSRNLEAILMRTGPETPLRPTTSAVPANGPVEGSVPDPAVPDRPRGNTILVPLADADSDQADSLRRELLLLSQLHDRNVVRVEGIEVRDGKLCAVTEAIDGEDLEAQLAKGHRFTTEEILHIGECIVRALGAASYQGFLHRDLRPAHVIMLEEGLVKVANFGPLARERTLSGGETPLPSAVAYMSPEQGTGQPLDIRANIYSVGAILYQLATQRTPFEGYDSTTSLLYQLLHINPVGPRQLGASIPTELERTILRCLSKAPADRYAQPSELLEALQQARESMSSGKLAAIRAEDDTGDFDIFEDQPLGEGGMGTLVRGRQRSLDRQVAIKVIREAFHAHPEFLQRFRREGELLAQIDNSNVVQIIGTGVWRGRLFYAMELVKGEDLAVRQMRGHRSPPEEILHIAEGVANALRAAWRYKIVHRDIKPSNIMITHEGTVKVADFGLAKSLRLPGAESRVIAGTPEYLSPEQGLGQKADIRSDIYSLGIVLYELAAGRHPFKEAQSSVAMIYQHVHTDPPPLETLDPKLPAGLRALIHRCLQKDPRERYADPDALLKALKAARKNMDQPLSEKRLPAAILPAPGRRIAAPVLLGLAGLLLLCAAGVFFLLPRRPAGLDSSFQSAYELALGLGNTAEAMRLAEAARGRNSREYREAERRDTGTRLRPLHDRALELVAAKDWAGAAEAYASLEPLADPERIAEYASARRFCSDLAQAAEREKKQDWASALETYKRLEPASSPPHRDYLQDCIRRVQARLAAPH